MTARPLLTPWFPPSIKPAREGYYECGACHNGTRHYFDGKKFYWSKTSRTELWAIPWRGLARKPK